MYGMSNTSHNKYRVRFWSTYGCLFACCSIVRQEESHNINEASDASYHPAPIVPHPIFILLPKAASEVTILHQLSLCCDGCSDS